LLAFENGPVRPGFHRIALASEGGESKLLFRQRNKKVVAARTQQPDIGKICGRNEPLLSQRFVAYSEVGWDEETAHH
jgi:hypothetical protein